jgi:hypothetical protein
MAKWSEDVEQFRRDVEEAAKELIIAQGRCKYDEEFLAEIFDGRENVSLPHGFYKEVLDDIESRLRAQGVAVDAR